MAVVLLVLCRFKVAMCRGPACECAAPCLFLRLTVARPLLRTHARTDTADVTSGASPPVSSTPRSASAVTTPTPQDSADAGTDLVQSNLALPRVQPSSFHDPLIGIPAPLAKAAHELLRQSCPDPRPSRMQAGVIRALATTGRDAFIQAGSGTGKTIAFALGTMARVRTSLGAVQVIVLAPTARLAVQTAAVMSHLGRHAGIGVLCVVGRAQSVGANLRGLRKHHPQVLVGSPGRVSQLVREGHVRLARVRSVVLDEADLLLLTPNLRHECKDVLDQAPADVQTVLVCATTPPAAIQRRAARILRSPTVLRMAPGSGDEEQHVQHFYAVHDGAPAQTDAVLCRVAQFLRERCSWVAACVHTPDDAEAAGPPVADAGAGADAGATTVATVASADAAGGTTPDSSPAGVTAPHTNVTRPGGSASPGAAPKSTSGATGEATATSATSNVSTGRDVLVFVRRKGAAGYVAAALRQAPTAVGIVEEAHSGVATAVTDAVVDSLSHPHPVAQEELARPALPLRGSSGGSPEVDEAGHAVTPGPATLLRVVVATDALARGMDFPAVSGVVCVGLPTQAASFVHRAGRCGRFGKRGTVVHVVSECELSKLTSLGATYGTPIAMMP